jgi:uncharacterized delta-60 repeat protein
MTTNYKILGQELNRLFYTCPENTNTIISKLKIKNTSYPANIDINIGPSASFSELADSFNPNLNNYVLSTVIQSDGKILIGGGFSTVGGVTRNRIARLNSDGTLDTGFDPDVSSVIYAIVIQSDGKILIGGGFTTVGGVERNFIARLNSDGTLDSGFNPNAQYVVNTIAIQSDGKILIGGQFTAVGGVARNYIARLNSDGTLDTGFNPNASAQLNTIAIQSDGKILIGGYFTTIGGVTRNRIARLNSDGTLDTGFNPNAGDVVITITIQSDGKILIGGVFTTIGGVTRRVIARLNSDGTLDTGINFNLNSDIFGDVNNIVIQSDNKILISGNFFKQGSLSVGSDYFGPTYNESDRKRIARFNSDGTQDFGFDPNTNGTTSSIAIQSDGRILIGGAFTTVGGVTRNYIARLVLQSANNNTYIVKNKEINFDETIEINGGIALEEGQILLVDTPNGEDVIIQAYGIEETI